MVTLVNEGLEFLAKLACGVSSAPFVDIALGTGSTAEGVTVAYSTVSANIINSNGGQRAAPATAAYEADYKATWTHTWTFSGSLAILQTYILTSAANGNKMLCYHKFTSVKNVEVGETLQLTFKMTESRSA